MHIRVKAGGAHVVLASRRKPGKGSRKELVLNIGQHESVGAAIKAWTSEADACRREATRLARLGGERATANAE